MDRKIIWEAVFWDFDGVIVDSVNLKTEAFAHMFRQYGPETEKAVVDYHVANGGVSRYEKFRYYYEKILEIPINEDILARLGKEFSDLVLQKIINAPFIPGAKETLEILHLSKVPCFLVSGTPEEELKKIVGSKSLKPFFKEVHGTPKTKAATLQDIILRKKYHPAKCLYLGDAITDYEAAKKNGVNFHGIIPEIKNSPFPLGTAVSRSFSPPLSSFFTKTNT